MASTESLTTPPEGYSDANHNVELYTIFSVFSCISLIAILARFVSRKIKHVAFGLDEVLLGIAWITALGEAIMFACSTKYAHGGWHISTLSSSQLIAFQKTFYASSFLQTTSLASSKLSVLILLHRIFVTRAFRITVWVLGGIVGAWWAAIFFGGAFICFPADSIWNLNIQGSCGNQKIMDLISPIPWVLTDFAILIAPIPVIKQLQLPRGQKIGLCAMFLIGGLTCITSVVRYRTLFYPVNDVSWDIVPAAEWNIIEVNVTVTCAALIACKPVVALMLSARPFSSIRARWSRFRSQRSGNSSRFRSQFGSRRGPFASSTHLREPPPLIPLYNHPRNDTVLQKSEGVRNTINTHEVHIGRPSEEAI